MTLVSEKRTLRREVSEARRSLSHQQMLAAGRSAADHLVLTPEYRSAAVVALYAPLAEEITTLPLFRAAREAGKQTLLPRPAREGALEFARVRCWEELRPGRYGVLEPSPEQSAVKLTRQDLAVLPGVAFDAAGGRLGRGGGAYDRTFRESGGDRPTLFGLALDLQIVAAVPCGEHDVGMDAVVSEAGVIRPPAGRERR